MFIFKLLLEPKEKRQERVESPSLSISPKGGNDTWEAMGERRGKDGERGAAGTM